MQHYLKEKLLKQLVNDDDNINRENADYFCDATEDYVKNKKDCDKLYDKVDKKEEEKEIKEDNENQEPIIEDWSNTVTEEEEQIQNEFYESKTRKIYKNFL